MLYIGECIISLMLQLGGMVVAYELDCLAHKRLPFHQ